MDDAMLVKLAAAQYIREMGSGAVPYLREMREIALSLSDADSALAWRDIEDAARAMLLAAAPAPRRPKTRAAPRMPVPIG